MAFARHRLLMLLALHVCITLTPYNSLTHAQETRPNLDTVPETESNPIRDVPILPAITPEDTSENLVNVVTAPIQKGTRKVYTKFFAQIPDYEGKPSKIVGITNNGRYLYVTTSSTGAYIYRVDEKGRVQLWFDVAKAVHSHTGRNISVTNGIHGGTRSIAFHPTFYRSGLFYISAMETRPVVEENYRYLSKPGPGESRASADSVVLEFRYDFAKKRVDSASYRQVLRIGMPFLDHPIKQMIFVGYFLYISHGDGSLQSGGGGGGQNNDALGKVLRINPMPFNFKPYSVPRSNPFIGNDAYPDEVYAVGFRNPHNICYSARSGLYVTDVGRDNVEEVNLVRAGRDYGWPKREGTFRHFERGGTGIGVTRLPIRDSMFNYTYPNAQVGHLAAENTRYTGQALAGACPVENGSKNNGLFFYVNFPLAGELYYSYIRGLQAAVTMGSPRELRQATTFRAQLFYDHDGDVYTPDIAVPDLRTIVRIDLNRTNLNRADVRFGRGRRGEIYWSSKSNGRLYVITSTIPSR